MKNIMMILVIVNSVFSQQITEITVGSKENEIELQIYNDSEIELSNVEVELLEVEESYSFDKLKSVIPVIEPFDTKTAVFMFGVDNSAELNSFNKLRFQIESLEQRWEKEIELKIIPPDEIKLSQNFPNPFNPSTKIEYSIPAAAMSTLGLSDVNLAIYDILGREVAILVNQNQKPGIYEVIFDGRNHASGMYFYRLNVYQADGEAGNYIEVKKMMLVK